MIVSRTLLVCALTLGVVGAQSRWQVEGGRMRARVDPDLELAPRASLEVDASAAVGVHFPCSAAGRPMSLRFAAPDGSTVRIGVDDAGPVTSLPMSRFGGALRAAGLTTQAGDVRVEVGTADDDAPRDYRVAVEVASAEGAGRFGVVARHGDGAGCYFFSIDRAAGLLRLERWHGAQHFVVRQAQLERPVGASCEVALEVVGFRLEAFVDDRPVLRTFDGGLPGGAPGLGWTGARPEFGELQLAAPAPRLPSAALVQVGSRATLHAALTSQPGSLLVVELALDRPHPWVPRAPSGFEPWVCQREAAPVVLWGDWRGSLGEAFPLEVPAEATVSAELRWPMLPALRGRTALVRAQVATADGHMLTERTRGVVLRF